MVFTDKQLSELKEKIKLRMSEKRFSHTLGVERCARTLAEALIPDRISEARAAALLHDVSKEIAREEQIKLLEDNKFELTNEDINTEGVIHSFTAPIVISRDFKMFATQDVLSSTLKHTVGDSEMSIFDKIIFISDYAEDTRRYESCIRVRELLFDGFDALSYADKLKRLDEACIAAIDGTCEALRKSGNHINSRMIGTRKSFESKKLP